MGKEIASGGFGTVYEATLNGEVVAVKVRNIDGGIHVNSIAEELREFRREVWLSSAISHRTIVGIRGFTLMPPSIVLECIRSFVHLYSP